MTALGIKDTDLNIKKQMEWHLTGNHFPPVPCAIIDPAIQAIEACNNYEPEKISRN